MGRGLHGHDVVKEGLDNSIRQLFRRREFGACPDLLALNQALACLIRWRAILGAREASIDQRFLNDPMLGNPKASLRGQSAESWGQQTSFHTQSVVDLLNESLVR